jgi:hypothetical protein
MGPQGAIGPVGPAGPQGPAGSSDLIKVYGTGRIVKRPHSGDALLGQHMVQTAVGFLPYIYIEDKFYDLVDISPGIFDICVDIPQNIPNIEVKAHCQGNYAGYIDAQRGGNIMLSSSECIGNCFLNGFYRGKLFRIMMTRTGNPNGLTNLTISYDAQGNVAEQGYLDITVIGIR